MSDGSPPPLDAQSLLKGAKYELAVNHSSPNALGLARGVLALLARVDDLERANYQLTKERDDHEWDDAVHIAAPWETRSSLCGKWRRMNLIALTTDRPDSMSGCWTCLMAAKAWDKNREAAEAEVARLTAALQAAEEWARTMEHERDYQLDVVEVDLEEKWRESASEVARLRTALSGEDWERIEIGLRAVLDDDDAVDAAMWLKESGYVVVRAALSGGAAAPYPVCVCGHRYDHHTDPGDPRKVGCHLCSCREYRPVSGAAAT